MLCESIVKTSAGEREADAGVVEGCGSGCVVAAGSGSHAPEAVGANAPEDSGDNVDEDAVAEAQFRITGGADIACCLPRSLRLN